MAALQKADLVGTLAGTGPFTVFAPTDAAFATFLDDIGVATLDEIDDQTLTQVLLYHVIDGLGSAVASSDVTDGLEVTMANGTDVTFTVANGILNLSLIHI